MSLKGYKVPDIQAEFDLTPMIDVVFLLIVFFMTVASMISEEKVDLNLAIAEEAAIPDSMANRFTFSVDNEGQFYAGAAKVSYDQLRGYIANVARIGDNPTVVLRAERYAEHSYVKQMMDACAENNISNIVFAAYQEK